MSNGGYDVALIVETFLKPHHKLMIPNFTVYCNVRATHGGDVAIAISKKITHTFIGSQQQNAIENIAVQVSLTGRATIIISACSVGMCADTLPRKIQINHYAIKR